MGQRSLRDATFVINDGGSETVTVKIGEGNITWSERRNVEYTHDRGALDTARLGDDEPCEVRFDFVWDWLEAGTDGQDIVGAIKLTNSGWVTTGDACEPDACDLVLTITDCSNTDIITFSDFRYDSIDYDLRAGTISCTGRCPANPVIT
jgi:hypothetical protein